MLAAALITGCEKTHLPEDNDDMNDTGKWQGTHWDDEVVPDTVADSFLTVEEAIMAETGSPINVRGYIVGAANRNIYNTIFAPPFESRSSLVLADRPLNIGDELYEDELFPVCLTDYKDTQRALNLVDHPEHWHRCIYIYGMKSSYMSMPGLKTVMKYEFAE